MNVLLRIILVKLEFIVDVRPILYVRLDERYRKFVTLETNLKARFKRRVGSFGDKIGRFIVPRPVLHLRCELPGPPTWIWSFNLIHSVLFNYFINVIYNFIVQYDV